MSKTLDSTSNAQVDRRWAPSLSERIAQTQRGYLAVQRFFRFEYLSFTLLLPLLGAATVPTPPTTIQLIGLLAAAVAFHIFMCLQNDVVDLPLDRTQLARAEYPLVKGSVQPLQAVALASIQIPIAFALTAWQRGSTWSYVALALAFTAMTIYNVWGKRTRYPILTDVIQGIAFALVCLYGAALLGAFTTLSFILSGGVVVWMVLTNLLGGLRDLTSDLSFGILTTAIQLGAKPLGDLGQVIPRRVRWYAYAWLAILIALISFALVQNDRSYGATTLAFIAAAVIILSAIAVLLLMAFFRAAKQHPRMIRIGGLQLAASSATGIVLLGPSVDQRLMLVIVIIFVLPQLTTHLRLLYAFWSMRRPRPNA